MAVKKVPIPGRSTKRRASTSEKRVECVRCGDLKEVKTGFYVGPDGKRRGRVCITCLRHERREKYAAGLWQ